MVLFLVVYFYIGINILISAHVSGGVCLFNILAILVWSFIFCLGVL